MKMTIWRRGKIAAFERICWVYFCLNILFALTPAHLSKHAWQISQGGLFIFAYQSITSCDRNITPSAPLRISGRRYLFWLASSVCD